MRARDSELDLLEEIEDKDSPDMCEESDPSKGRDQIVQKSVECELMMMKVKDWISYQGKLLTRSTKSTEVDGSKEAKLESICDFLLSKLPNKA